MKEVSVLDEINNHGQVVGRMKRFGHDSHGFLLTPVTWSFTLGALEPGRRGVMNRMEISGAPANAEVHILASPIGGGHLIPGCSTLQNALQLKNPRKVTIVTTDADGHAIASGLLDHDIPPGQTLLIQAVIHETCEISNLVVQAIE